MSDKKLSPLEMMAEAERLSNENLDRVLKPHAGFSGDINIVSGNINRIFTKKPDQDAKFVSARFTNVKSDLIEITHDKLENILTKHYEKRFLRSAWFNPASLGVGVALTLATAEFKTNAFGIEAATWKAIFVLLFVGSVGWLIYNLVRLAIYWKESKIESLIDMLKDKSK